ncbi:MAG: hypothetical protein ACXWLB_07170, partial [Reyranella sp.]
PPGPSARAAAARPVIKTIARAIVFDVLPAILAATGTIDRTSAIHLAVVPSKTSAVSSDANAGLNAHTACAHADTGSDADTDRARTNAWIDAHAARADAIRLPDTALRRAICIAINRGLSR